MAEVDATEEKEKHYIWITRDERMTKAVCKRDSYSFGPTSLKIMAVTKLMD